MGSVAAPHFPWWTVKTVKTVVTRAVLTVSYLLARGKSAAITRESGEIAAYSLAPWREQSLALKYLDRAAPAGTEGKHRNRC